MNVRSFVPILLISCGALAVAAQISVPSAPRNLRIGLGGSGIAARYPGDAGIENDPDVLFAENFEEPTTTALFGRWTDIRNGARMLFSSDVPSGSSGSKSLSIEWVGGASNGGHLYRPLSSGVDDTVYLRYYIKYPSSARYIHSGIWMGGRNPLTAWPDPQAGLKPAGNDRFSTAVEQAHTTRRLDHYNYWMDMRQASDGNFWGDLLLNDPSVTGKSDAWMCLEHMVKLNSPATSSNGEHAIWRDGVKISHVGAGFPKGFWSGGIFTQDPTGTPFGGLRWRSDSALKLNWIWLQAYAPEDPAGFAGSMKFDHVVVAKTYVGCLGQAAGPSLPVAQVMVSPASVSLPVGQSQTLIATLKDANGATLSGRAVSWSSANPGVATVNTTGLVSAVSAGSTTVTATSEGKSGSASVTIPSSTAPWPNEPSGWRVLTDWGFDQAPPIGGDKPIPGSPGWSVVSAGGVRLTTDSTARSSPSNVYDFVYPQGMVEGGAPGTVYHAISGRQIYMGFWWKPSSPFDTGPGGNKIVFLFNGGGDGGGQQFLMLRPSGLVELLPEYANDVRWRGANINPTKVTLGVWHRIEWYTDVASGVVKWWLDGVLQGSHTDVRNSFNFDEVKFSPTWGGNGGALKRQTDHYWFDHVRISIP
jgi:Bacterial Ig-like domain (group 2)